MLYRIYSVLYIYDTMFDILSKTLIGYSHQTHHQSDYTREFWPAISIGNIVVYVKMSVFIICFVRYSRGFVISTFILATSYISCLVFIFHIIMYIL